MTINLEDFCSVKKSDFDEIFDDFFYTTSIKKSELTEEI
jgi:hypothetical protein